MFRVLAATLSAPVAASHSRLKHLPRININNVLDNSQTIKTVRMLCGDVAGLALAALRQRGDRQCGTVT